MPRSGVREPAQKVFDAGLEGLRALQVRQMSGAGDADERGVGQHGGNRFRFGRRRQHVFVADDPPKTTIAELGDLGGAIGASLLFAN